MLDLEKNCRVAVVQCSPVMFYKNQHMPNCFVFFSLQVTAEDRI